MKKTLLFIFVTLCILIFSLVGCSSNTQPNESDTSNNVTSNVQSTDEILSFDSFDDATLDNIFKSKLATIYESSDGTDAQVDGTLNDFEGIYMTRRASDGTQNVYFQSDVMSDFFKKDEFGEIMVNDNNQYYIDEVLLAKEIDNFSTKFENFIKQNNLKFLDTTIIMNSGEIKSTDKPLSVDEIFNLFYSDEYSEETSMSYARTINLEYYNEKDIYTLSLLYTIDNPYSGYVLKMRVLCEGR